MGNLKENKDVILKKIQEKTNELLKESFSVKSEIVQYDQVEKVCGKSFDYLPKDQPARIVTIFENYAYQFLSDFITVAHFRLVVLAVELMLTI